MNDTLLMDYSDLEEEVVYSEEEIEAIYRDYQQRVLKKAEFKMWCRRYLNVR